MSDLNIREATQKQGYGRKVLLLLAVVFVLPFTIAAVLHWLDIRPGGKSFGTLITPPIALNIPDLTDAQDKPFAAARWQKKWSIVLIDRSGCAQPCQATTALLGKVHASLNKEIKRVQRILVLPENNHSEAIAALQTQFPDLIILVGADTATLEFVSKFEASTSAQSVYLVDPLGNLMMHYPVKIDPKAVRGDLVRLLKNSWAG